MFRPEEYFAHMNTCPQCGAAVPEKKAFCDECAKTMMPPPPKTQRSAKKTATTVLTQRSKAKGKGRSTKDAAKKRPGVLSLYWQKRKRTDEE
jgi:predicted nucleic acid-binding Zn ribbon protein